MTRTPSTNITFEYTIPVATTITMSTLRKTLREVKDLLLSHEINGGPRKLRMETVCQDHKCGMAACIGGWTGVLLLGFEAGTAQQQTVLHDLFDNLLYLDAMAEGRGRLSNLFHGFYGTEDYNEPNVAATAIARYLGGKAIPWPNGAMPNIRPYTKRAKRK